jgi:hypothetical protein
LCKVPTKEAWGEYCILSPEKSSRSTSGSPLSKSAKQAWVVEQTFVEQQMSVFQQSERATDLPCMIEDNWCSPGAPSIDKQNSAGWENDVLGSDDVLTSAYVVCTRWLFIHNGQAI